MRPRWTGVAHYCSRDLGRCNMRGSRNGDGHSEVAEKPCACDDADDGLHPGCVYGKALH